MNFKNSTILITGGTGTLGRALLRYLLDKPVTKLVSFSRHEASVVYLKRELAPFDSHHRLRFFIGDVRDKEALLRALSGVDYVIHTAALKNLETTEYSPFETIKTNIHGAQNLIDVAVERGVKKVLAISTDKAVDPVSLYGATKLCSDKLFVHGNVYSGKFGCKFSVVRFGNFVGSSGSVIPHFYSLLSKQTTLPVTDFRMTRYFITLKDACDACVKVLDRMSGGEIFVPKMGKINIRDLALHISERVEEVGRRRGEKIHEVLLPETDLLTTVEWENFYIIFPGKPVYGRPVPPSVNTSSECCGAWLNPKELLDEHAKTARCSS